MAETEHHRPFGRNDLLAERTVAITVGLRVPHELPGGAAGLRDFAARVEATGIDRLFVGDHVTFRGGAGFDGLVNAAALAVATRRVTVQTAVYLLPLRHPVPVARQVASLAALAPGRSAARMRSVPSCSRTGAIAYCCHCFGRYRVNESRVS